MRIFIFNYGSIYKKLPYPRYNHPALLAVLAPKLAAISVFLFSRPKPHLGSCHNGKQDRARTPRHHDDRDPDQDLEHVIGACDQLERSPARDAAVGGAGAAQVS